tara:strand:+ start:331 stop:1377 length:1047 start_codon:yes stop_codon:yes gene_type:complete
MIKVNKKTISRDHSPFIIAEISGNHKGSLSRALKIIDEAKKAGASAVKLQTFELDEITLNSKSKFFKIVDKNSPWNGRYLHDLYKEAITPKKWHKKIFSYAKKKNILCFSSVFDLKSLKFLESLNCPIYKIASFENNHYPLIDAVSKTGKPVIISTGMSDLKQIKEIVKIFKKNRNRNFAFLKCTSSYPADARSSNLKSIELLRKELKCEIGLSDHTLGIGAAVASISFGSSIIEKHIVLKKNDGSIDKDFSLTPIEFKSLVTEANLAWQALGKRNLNLHSSERKNSRLKRSIFVSKDLKAGQKISEDYIKIVRPNHGVQPKYYNLVLRKRAKKIIKKGTPLKFNLLK